jgi:folate-binding protein YgfZ
MMNPRSPLAGILLAGGMVQVEQHGQAVLDTSDDNSNATKAWSDGALVFDQSLRGKVEVTGPEAALFLHNLCTNDIVGMPVGAGCEAFFANARARSVAWANIYHVVLSRGREGFWIDLPPGLEDILLRHLDRHLISEQAEFCDRTSDLAQFHLAGPRARAILSSALQTDIPDLDLWQHMERTIGHDAVCHIRRIDLLGKPGYDIAFLVKHGKAVWQALNQSGATPGGYSMWQNLRIVAGLPEQGKEIDENVFIPELGRNAVAVSGSKGCYLGQEPIVMARDRGQINRRLTMLIGCPADCSPGDTLWSADREIGRITSVAASDVTGSRVGLAFTRRGFWDAGTAMAVRGKDGQSGEAIVKAWPEPESTPAQ